MPLNSFYRLALALGIRLMQDVWLPPFGPVTILQIVLSFSSSQAPQLQLYRCLDTDLYGPRCLKYHENRESHLVHKDTAAANAEHGGATELGQHSL